MNFDSANAPLWIALGLLVAFEAWQLFRRPTVHPSAPAPVLRPPVSVRVTDPEYQTALNVVRAKIQSEVSAKVAAEILGTQGG